MASKHLKKTESGPQPPEERDLPGEDTGPGRDGTPEPQGRHAAPSPEPEREPRGRHSLPDVEPPEEEYAARPEPPGGRHAVPAREPEEEPAQDEPAGSEKKKKKKKKRASKKAKRSEKSGADQTADAEEQTVQAVMRALEGGGDDPAPQKPVLVPTPETPPEGPAPVQLNAAPADGADGEQTGQPEKKKKVSFRRVRAKRAPGEERPPLLSHRDAVGAIISLIAAAVLLAAAIVIWFYRDSFSPDKLIYSADSAAVAQEEYLFDAGSGEAFAAAGQGLAVANSAGLELLDGSGTPVTSMVLQMENPTAAGCSDFALFYDLGGRRFAVARFDGTVEEMTTEGDILSATVSSGGYIAITTEATGFRALVTIYDPALETVYRWYSSSAWVMSANVSPDGRKLAVLSYTATGSEIRFFSLDSDQQQGAFPISGTILLDMHWFTSNQLCAISSDQALFFDADGQWQNTYGFSGQYLIGYTFDGSNCAALALSPYRAGTTAKLVSLDSTGNELGSADIQSELVCLTARDLEIMALCSDGAVLYNSSLSEKGRLPGLTGFKYGLLRARGEALLIAPNYAEVYSF